jgi:hypothetical protein
MRTLIVAPLILLLASPAAHADSAADLLAQGKIEADLGRYAEATQAFTAVSTAAGVTPAQRAEALVRLGCARRAAKDELGAFKAFERAARDPGRNRDVTALLVEALGGAVPSAERWDQIWSQVRFVTAAFKADPSQPADHDRPGLVVRWPDSASRGARSYHGDRISLDVQDGDIVDLMRLFSRIGNTNVVTDPSVQGRVTVKLADVPWDEALDRVAAENGLTVRREDDVFWVTSVGGLGAKTGYTGHPVNFDFKNGQLVDVMRLFADISDLNIVAPGVDGKVNLSLAQMPWDKAFDIVLKVHGLVSRREGNVLWVSSGSMPPLRSYFGKPIDVEFKDKDVLDALNEVVQIGGGTITIDPEIKPGPATVPVSLKLKQVPWDQALDLVARCGSLQVTGEGDRFVVRPLNQARRAGRRPGLSGWAVRELSVRGIVKRDAGYIALLLDPDGKTWFAENGAKLQDGAVRVIDGGGVTFDESKEGVGHEVRKALVPGAAPARTAYRGHALSVDYKDANLSDVFRLIADATGRNVVVFPGIAGRITFAAQSLPWDEMLERILTPNGLAARWDGNVVLIGRPEQIGTARRGAGVGATTKYAGAAISLDLKDADLLGALAQIAEANGAAARFDPRIAGRVTIKLNEVPWDQALDVIVKTNGLEWTRADATFSILVPRKEGATASGEGPLKAAPSRTLAELDAGQLTLRGILGKDKNAIRIALVEAPDRTTEAAAPGAILRDATVVAVDNASLTLRQGDRQIRMTLYPQR